MNTFSELGRTVINLKSKVTYICSVILFAFSLYTNIV